MLIKAKSLIFFDVVIVSFSVLNHRIIKTNLNATYCNLHSIFICTLSCVCVFLLKHLSLSLYFIELDLFVSFEMALHLMKSSIRALLLNTSCCSYNGARMINIIKQDILTQNEKSWIEEQSKKLLENAKCKNFTLIETENFLLNVI